jgi:hypothetical protein
VAAGALCGDDEGWIGPKKWLMDTGSAVDLVSVHDIPAKWEKSILTGGPKIKLSTANGFMLADKRIPLQVGSFGGIEVEPLLLPSTPPVLSVGKRCMEEGYTFVWPAGKNPFMIGPNQERFDLEVKDFVPYLLDGPEQYQERESAPVITFIGDRLGSGSPVPALPSAGSPAGGDETDGDAADDEFSDDEPLTEDEALVEPSRDLRAEATSLSHLLTHMPKKPYCPSCVRAKWQRARAGGASEKRAKSRKSSAKSSPPITLCSGRRTWVVLGRGQRLWYGILPLGGSHAIRCPTNLRKVRGQHLTTLRVLGAWCSCFTVTTPPS